MLDDPVGREADRLLARQLDIARQGRRREFARVAGVRLAEQPGRRRVVVGRPGVVHRRGAVPEVASMHGGPRIVVANALEQDLVPDPCDRFIAVVRSQRLGIDAPATVAAGDTQ